MCDRGRFNFEAVRADDRLGAPLVRGEGGLAAGVVGRRHDRRGPTRHRGPRSRRTGQHRRARRRARHQRGRLRLGPLADALDVPHRDAQLADGLPAELLLLPRATIDEAAAASTVVLLGPDLKEELPVLYLRLRHAAEQGRTRLVELGPVATGLTTYAWRSVRVEAGAVGAVQTALADHEIVDQLRAGPVVVVAGRANLAESADAAASSLRAVLDACPEAKVLPALRRGNVVGALQLGLAPHDDGLDGVGILAAAAEGRVDLLVLLGADPIADCPDADLARRAIAGARRIIAVDTFLTESSGAADVVLAAAAYGEKSGTTTNLEGRVTEVGKKISVAGTSRPDWMIAAELAERLGLDDLATTLGSVEAITDAIAASVPAYAAATRRALRTSRDGVLAVPTPDAAAFPEPTAGRARPDQLRLPAGVDAQALRPGRRDGEVAVAGPARPEQRRPRQPARPRPARHRRRLRGPHHRRHAARSSSPSSPTAACRAARCRCRSTCRAPSSPDIIDAHGAGHRRPGGAPLMLAIDPLLDGGLLWTPLFIVRAQGARHLRRRPRRHDVHGLVRAQDDRRPAEPRRAQQGRPVRPPADARRRHEADLQGGLPPRPGRPHRLPVGAVPGLRAGVPRVVGHPARRRLPRRPRSASSRGSATRRACSSPTRRSASCSCWRCRRSPSTASCSPAGRAARSTRCSAPCGRRRR